MKKEFNDRYEKEYREKINVLADENGLCNSYNELLIARYENGSFNHVPHIAHMGLETFRSYLDKVPFIEKFNLVSVGHYAIDYAAAYSDHQSNKKLNELYGKFSRDFIQTLEVFVNRPADNYIDALCQQKILADFPMRGFLDPLHFEKLKQFQDQKQASVNLFAANETEETRIQILGVSEQNAIIIEQQKAYIDGEKKLLEILNNISNGQQVSDAKIIEIKNLLSESGIISIEGGLDQLLQRSDLAIDGIKNILEHIQKEGFKKLHEKLSQETHEQRLAAYQAFEASCGFVNALGQYIGSENLVITAGIAQATVQIYKSVDQLFSAQSIGLALINPTAAVGIAVLNIFSMFQKRQDPNKVIMKQLVKISKQISDLHKKMLENNNLVNERLAHLLERIESGFQYLQLSQTITVVQRLDEIQSQLKQLWKLTKVGFEELLLGPLQGHIWHIEDIREGIIIDFSKEDYQNRLQNLRDFVLKKSSSEILNGSIYSGLLKNSPEHTSQWIDLFKSQKDSSLYDIFGLIAIFLKEHLCLSNCQSIDVQSIFHLQLWRISVQAYLDLHRAGLERHQYQYDPQQINLKKFREQSDNFLSLLTQLQSSRELYQLLFNKIIACNQATENAYRQSISVNEHPIFQGPAQLTYTLPPNFQNNGELIKITQEYFSNHTWRNKLKNFGIEIPKEFESAEQLGLGYFSSEVYLPSSIYKKHHKHTNKFRVPSGGLAGVELSFIKGGEKFILSSPRVFPGKYNPKKGRNGGYKAQTLPELYDYLIQTCTVKSYTMQMCSSIAQSLQQSDVGRKKSLALKIASNIKDNLHYHELIKLNYIFLAILDCAGFSKSIRDKVCKELLLDDIARPFEIYARSADHNTPFPLTPNFSITSRLEEIRDYFINNLLKGTIMLNLIPEILMFKNVVNELPGPTLPIVSVESFEVPALAVPPLGNENTRETVHVMLPVMRTIIPWDEAKHVHGDGNIIFLLAKNMDLVAVKKSKTGTNSTEVHILSAATEYKKFILHIGTPLHETDDNFQFILAENRDLVAIKKSQTGSGSTEIHILSAASNYQNFILQSGTGLHQVTENNFEFLFAPNRDLIAIKKSQTGSNSTEVYVLSVASGYKNFSLQTRTLLEETGDDFRFLLWNSMDILAIRKKQVDNNLTAKAYILPALSSYGSLEVLKGKLLYEIKGKIDVLSKPNDPGVIVGIKKSEIPNAPLEIHAISRNEQSFFNQPSQAPTNIANDFESVDVQYDKNSETLIANSCKIL